MLNLLKSTDFSAFYKVAEILLLPFYYVVSFIWELQIFYIQGLYETNFEDNIASGK